MWGANFFFFKRKKFARPLFFFSPCAGGVFTNPLF
ncbi:hypothetical protein EBI_25940 [Enterocytozoon bieneusi H348]|nr:hypothetical protein EBI_25940 [Enterocytozoon bieneusi H348]|eukprot:XP_002651008.1 hypothetical protein EBI_25940 [Enterocytozoon bieneusi H348]